MGSKGEELVGDEWLCNPPQADYVALSACGGSLRRTESTPRDVRFARLELDAFYFAIGFETFYEFIRYFLDKLLFSLYLH